MIDNGGRQIRKIGYKFRSMNFSVIKSSYLLIAHLKDTERTLLKLNMLLKLPGQCIQQASPFLYTFSKINKSW